MPYWQFLRYNTAGVILGISQFVVVGYFFGSNWQSVLSIVKRDIRLVFLVLIGVAAVYWGVRKYLSHTLQ